MTERLHGLDQPSEDETRTWHVHDEGGWAWGVVCDVCRVERPSPPPGPFFNIKMLQKQNATGMSTRMEEREALGDRWNDPRIGRVR